MKKITLLLAFAMMFSFAHAQTAEEIIETYYETIGGIDAFNKINGIKMLAKVNTPNVGELPITIITFKDGRQLVKFELQGQELVQVAFDGETSWAHNFANMQAEKSDSETTENLKRSIKDFPSQLFNYKEKGYTVELLENEAFEGTDCFKIRLIGTPLLVDGKDVENSTYLYFDTETSVLLATESEAKIGQAKGYTTQTVFSDYQEVDGIYFAFTMTQGIKGRPGQPMNIESIEINPEVDDSIFAFPGATTEERK